jgi:Ca2+-binding EF-hand superfamily protein
MIQDELMRRYGQDLTHVERYQKLFQEYDKDESGTIDMDEFALLCGDLGLPMSPTQLEQVMAALDTTKDGKLSIDELKAWLEMAY